MIRRSGTVSRSTAAHDGAPVADQVFVDASGRRGRVLRWIGALLGLGCLDCIEQWEHRRVAHVDVWAGMSGPGLHICEQALTPDAPVPIEVNPPPERPTDPRPLYTPSGGCRVPS